MSELGWNRISPANAAARCFYMFIHETVYDKQLSPVLLSLLAAAVRRTNTCLHRPVAL
jgi:hypothetical protein